MEIISIDTEYITLTQFLKLIGLINTGGQAKFFLLDNYVVLNGEIENRRGKKIYPGDFIVVDSEEFKIERN